MEEYYDALGEVASVIHKSGATISRGVPSDPRVQTDHRGYAINYDGAHLYVTGTPRQRYFEVSYANDLTNHLRSRFSAEDHRRIDETVSDDLSESEALDHYYRQHLPRTDDDDTSAVLDEMKQLADDPSLSLSFAGYDEEGEYLASFTVRQRLYPYEGLALSEFDATASEVAHAGGKLTEVFLDRFLDVHDESAQHGDQSPPKEAPTDTAPLPGFQ